MKLTILLAVLTLAWDQSNPELVTNWELWTWVNNGQVTKDIVTVLPTDENGYEVSKNATIGDEFHAKVRACDDTQCSEWSEELVHIITETQDIVIQRPGNITIKIRIE